MIGFIKNVCGRIQLLMAVMCAAATASAAPIEHSGDRYIINVSEMELNGDETVMDVLLMCPEVITLDAKQPLTSSLYGQWAVRIDNIGLGLDNETYLTTTRASEVEKIKVCTNPGVLKGCGGLKMVLDIYLRKADNGTSGRVAVSGDSYGKGKAFVSALHQKDNLRLFGIAEGNIARSKFDGVTSHGGHEAMKMNMVWDITSKDNLEFDFSQSFNRSRTVGDPAAYDRYMHLEGVYLRSLSDAGAYALFQFAGDYGSANSLAGVRSRYTDPFALLEFSFPLVNHNLWLTAGVESGYDAQTDRIAEYTNRSRYEDLYAQVDWKVGKWNFMVGDRFRVLNFWMNSLKDFEEWEHTTSNHAYTATVYYNFNANSTLQGSFARRYYNAAYENFIADGMYYNPVVNNIMAGKIYTKDYDKQIAYVSDLKYSFSKPDFTFSTLLRNIRQDLAVGHDNTLSIGASAFWHKGILRLTAGFDYFWQKTSYSDTYKKYNNFVNLKLAPQVSLDNGWRFTSTMLYNSRKAYDSEFYAPANFYADVAVSKRFGKNWLVEGKYHDIAGQNTGNRAATIGVTYFWGK
ncbi:MAG: hypothetical protein Q4E63_00680 [Prevotellaceae bacterium]|nr:hypothetical protein [Prevotellaceae bacterium]MDO4931156.1 hypothetical protein [Prevotellaceae bacterium]